MTAASLYFCAAALAPTGHAGAGEPRHELPKVASINLCTDQLVLLLADDEQILTLSWLSADPEESMLAARAAEFPPNYGTAEEMLRFDPNVIVAGTLTSAFTRALLERLGYRVVEIAPAASVADIAANIEQVAAAIGQRARGAAVVAALEKRRAELERAGAGRRVGAVVLRPGGFTVGRHTLAQELMSIAGLDNLAADRGLDRWGSLSIETLLRARPALLILTDYRRGEASLANTVFAHPALHDLAAHTASLVVPAAEWGCGLPQSLDSAAAMERAAAPLRAKP
ncbi:MAG TPA: ABC transporter substrate-binding protein [Gammaproteobacteria bacterium]|nr:ABC transporter substrate-binding protein [Gammaproteobacteria bacterium]